MKNLFIRLVALLGAAMAVHGVSAQEPQKHEAELRFDQAQREELADEPFPAVAVDSAVAGRPFAYKLNRKRTTEAAAYDAVTLWNVRKVKIRDRRMKLTDSTRREKVRLLKFFTERDRKKGARPHLLGNVAGYTWSNRIYDETARTRRTVPKHIATYTLRDEYDSVRRAGGDVSMFQVPEELWRRLSPKAVYVAASSSLSTGCSCVRSKSIPTPGQWHVTIPTRGLSSGMYTPTGYPWWSSAASPRRSNRG